MRRFLCGLIVVAVAGSVWAAPARRAGRVDDPQKADRRLVASPYAEIELAPFDGPRDGAVALRMTVRPRPGIHIYAPGQRGYYPVSVTFAPGSGVTPVRLDLPPAEPYVFAPTGERFLIYRDAFTLTQHVRLAPGAAAARARRPTGMLQGTLHYQACDDRVCYRPQAVRLTWSRRRAAPPRTGGPS